MWPTLFFTEFPESLFYIQWSDLCITFIRPDYTGRVKCFFKECISVSFLKHFCSLSRLFQGVDDDDDEYWSDEDEWKWVQRHHREECYQRTDTCCVHPLTLSPFKKNFSVVPKCSYWSDCWRRLRKAKKQKCCLLFVWREAVRGPLDLNHFIRAWKQQTCPKTILQIISCVHDQHVPSYTISKSTSSLCSVSKVKTFVPVAVKTECSPKFWNYLIPY